MKSMGKLDRARKKKNRGRGGGGRGRNGRRACKTKKWTGSGIPAPGIPSDRSILAVFVNTRVIHDNQHYSENALRARFRGIQVMSYFARMSPTFSITNIFFYMF